MMHFGFPIYLILIGGLAITGFYLLALWAKDNLAKKKLLYFASALLTLAVILSLLMCLTSYKKMYFKDYKDDRDPELIKMKELLSIE